jgi:outer membrane lipoprotein-sorting protein
VIAVNKTVRWLPAIIAPVLVVAGAIAIPAAANAAPVLPQKTAQQVLAMIAGAHDASYSGTISQSSDLGLPQLPSVGAGSSSAGSNSTSTLLDLLTADHTVRLYVDGASKERVQVLDNLAERDIIRNGSTVWTYDSKAKAVTKATLPAHSPEAGSPSTTTPTPAQLADRAIAAITPSTTVDVITTARVAGRPVYQLALTPKSSSTLVATVTLSVDAETGLPLKVVIDARGQQADAFSVGFSSVDFSTPAAALFDFTPPSGATVTTAQLPTQSGLRGQQSDASAHATPTVIGSGWDTIVALPAAASGAAGLSASASQTKLLGELTTPVAGGRALQTSLLSVLLLDDGRVLVGAVPIASLEAAAQ